MQRSWLARTVLVLAFIATFTLGLLVQRSGLFDQIAKYWSDIFYLTRQHVRLVAISGGLAILAGVPIGLALSRPAMRRSAESIMQALNIGSTIPTLAVIALSMTLLGIGALPAIFGLWIASLLPIVRNTYAGVLGVPAYFVEAAEGRPSRTSSATRPTGSTPGSAPRTRCRCSRTSRFRTRCSSPSPASARPWRSMSARHRSRS